MQDTNHIKKYTDWYNDFKYQVLRSNRFFHSGEVMNFLELVYEIASENLVSLEENHEIYRARKGSENAEYINSESGSEYVEFYESGEMPRAFELDYFPPKSFFGAGGRANPEGISYLYAANNPETAVSEVRAEVGEAISVATLKAKRKLKLACFIEKVGFHFGFFDEKVALSVSESEARKLLLSEMSKDFSKPTKGSMNLRDYLPTQIISEYLRTKNIDGVVYETQFSASLIKDTIRCMETNVSRFEYDEPKVGYNLALFEPGNFEIVSASLYRLEQNLKLIIKGSESPLKPHNGINYKEVFERTKLEKDVFAHIIGVDFRDLDSWINGKAVPPESVRRMFYLIDKDPKSIIKLLRE